MNRVSQPAAGNGIFQVSRAPKTLIFLGALYLLDLILVPFVESVRGGEEVLLSVLLGAIVGQCAIVAILGGLYGTSWIDGFIPAGFAVVIGVFCFLFGILIDNKFGQRSIPPDFWPVFGTVPGIMFAVFAPLLLMRHLANWRLVEVGRIYPKQPADLTSIFTNTAAVAAIIMLLRMPQMVWEVGPTVFWPWAMVCGLIIVLISAAVTVPLAKFVLNCDLQLLRLARLAGSAFAAYAIFIVGLTIIGEVVREPMPREFYGYSMLATCSAVFVTHIGISAIRADGFRLRTKTNWLAEATLPATEQEKFNAEEYLHQHAKRVRMQIGALMILTVGLNIYVNATQSRKARFDRNIATLRAKLDELDCKYGINRDSLSIRFGSSKKSDDFGRVLEFQQEARELGMHKMVSKLDFSGCEIGDNVLSFLWGFENVQALDISDTDVRLQSTHNLQNVALRDLRAANLDLTNAAWHQLNLSALESLKLDGSKIDADELALALKTTKLEDIKLGHVDLSTSLIDRIIAQKKIEKLTLDGTSVDDAFVDRLNLRDLVDLNLSFTNVSDACCDSIGNASPFGRVGLAGNAITDMGVARLKKADFLCLDLSKTQITSDAVKNWRTLPTTLILAETKVDDGIADGLDTHNPRILLRHLDLRRTKVTDAVLPVLVQLNCELVDITDTAITGQALIDVLKQESAKVATWRVGAKQFSPQELKTLDQLGDVDPR